MSSFLAGLASFLGGLLAKLFSSPSRLQTQTDKAARAEEREQQAEHEAKVQASVAQAVTDAPKDTQAVIDVLRKGAF